MNRSDTFIRANGAIGTPSDGLGAYSFTTGTWVVDTNSGCDSAPGLQTTCVLDASSPNVQVNANLFVYGFDCGLCVRWTDDVNNIVNNAISGSITGIYKRVANSFTNLFNDGGATTWASSDDIDLRADSSDVITIYKNGSPIGNTSPETFNNTATKHGMRLHSDPSTRFRSLDITDLNSGGSTGSLAYTNANDTSAASGTTTILGTLAKTNANDTSVASGTTTVTGTLAKTNANDTVVASGSTGQATGTVAYTNANDTSVASGTTTVIGTLARTNANDSVVASGVAGAVSGTLAYTNNNDTCVASGSTPSSSVFGRDGLGGDDVPYRKSPHRGWDKAEWKRRKQFEDGLESTLRETYQRLMGIPAVAAKVDVIVKPVIVNDEPKIDWTKLAKSYARSNALIKLDQEEADLRAAIDEEDEFLMAMI